MTGCLYISPYEPALIADTLTGRPDIPLKNVTRPSNIGPDTPYSYVRANLLSRKLFIIDDLNATAWAGNAARIKPCLEEFIASKSEWEHSERPMKSLSELADRHGVNAMGVSVLSSPPDKPMLLNVCLFRPEDKITLPALNVCGAIGTGKGELIEIAKNYSAILDAWPKPRSGSRAYMIRGMASSINANNLAQEMYYKKLETWGAFFEYIYFDIELGRWSFGPPSTYHFALALPVRGGKITVKGIDRMYAYDPGEEWGRILTIRQADDGRILADEIILNNILNPGANPKGNVEFWKEWRPKSSTINIHFIEINKYITKSADPDEMKHIKFSFSAGFSVANEYWDSVSIEACKYHGYEYVPWDDLSLAEKELAVSAIRRPS